MDCLVGKRTKNISEVKTDDSYKESRGTVRLIYGKNVSILKIGFLSTETDLIGNFNGASSLLVQVDHI